VVPEGWSKPDPITLWVSEIGFNTSAPDSWGEPLRGGRKMDDDSNLRRLVDEDAEKRGFHSAPGVAIMSWSDHPREDLVSDLRLELWVLIAVDAAVPAALLIRG